MKINFEDNINRKFNLNQTFSETDLDYSVAENLASGLRHIETMTNSCFWIFDYYKNNFYYIAQNTDFFLETNRNLVIENGYDYFIRNTHPNDILYLLTIHKTTWNFFQQSSRLQTNNRLQNFVHYSTKKHKRNLRTYLPNRKTYCIG